MDGREKKKLYDFIRNSAATRVTLNRTNDGSKMQGSQVTGLSGEDFLEVERFQNYGFSSVPPDGAEGIALPVGGDRGHLVVVAIEDRGVRKGGLGAGDVAIYNGNGDYLLFKEGNKTELKSKEVLFDFGSKMDLKAPIIEITGDVKIIGNLTVTGSVSATGDITAGGISLVNHTHPGDSGGTTGKPR
ncbi:MAG: phage baseplate assembly protein V [Deltaproteobacteria bacterium]|jgi:phage baseplate assembly protein V|nr:phage baseplate assembly protein V [Deltaproteobacteria bacterium]